MSIDVSPQILNSPAVNTPEDIAVIHRLIQAQPDAAQLADMLGLGDAA